MSPDAALRSATRRKGVQALDADGFFCLKWDQYYPLCKLFDFLDLRNLGRRAGPQHRITGLSRCKTTVDNPRERLDLRSAQVVLQRARLKHRCRLGQGHNQDLGVPWVLQHHEGGPNASPACSGLLRQLPVVSARGVQQKERMTGRSGIDDHQLLPRSHDDAREGLKYSNLLVAR